MIRFKSRMLAAALAAAVVWASPVQYAVFAAESAVEEKAEARAETSAEQETEEAGREAEYAAAGNSDAGAMESEVIEEGSAKDVKDEDSESAEQSGTAMTAEGFALPQEGSTAETAAVEEPQDTDHNEAAGSVQTKKETADSMPAFEARMTAGSCVVRIKAAAGVFPEGTKAVVSEISGSAAKLYAGKAEELSGEGIAVAVIDIQFTDRNGIEIQPAGPVDVVFENAAEDNAEMSVYHAVDNNAADMESVPTKVEGNDVTFENDSFSPYVLLASTQTPNWTSGGAGTRKDVSDQLSIVHDDMYIYNYNDYDYYDGDEGQWVTVCYGVYLNGKRVGWAQCCDPRRYGFDLEGLKAGKVYEITAPMLVKAMYYGPDGPGKSTIREVVGTDDFGELSIVAHVAASEIYARLGYAEHSNPGDGLYGASNKLKNNVYKFVNTIESLPVPEGYYCYVTAQNGYSEGGSVRQDFGFGSYSLLAHIRVRKTSSDPSLSNGNSCYSFEGARYWIYTSEAAAKARGDDGWVSGGALNVNFDGDSNSFTLAPGTYYLIEGKTAKGFQLSDRVYKCIVSVAQTTVVDTTDVPCNYPVAIVIDKKCRGAEDGNINSLEGTRFTISYYDGYYDASDLPEQASRTWEINTLKTEDGRFRAVLDEEHLVGGDSFYTVDGQITLPLGTITIRETQVAEGYINDGMFGDSQMYIGQIVAGSDGKASLKDIQGQRTTENSFEVSDSPQPPQIITKAVDKITGTKTALAEGEVRIEDTVNYENLVVGNKYVLKGRLIDKETGEAIRDADGKEVTAEKSFTAKSLSGSVTLVFSFTSDGSLEGKSAVAFETVRYAGRDIAVHADIEDESQTVHFPKVRTTAVNPGTGDHIMAASGEAVITDTVSYENLVPGLEYTLKGVLMSPSGGAFTADGEEVTAEKVFIPDSPDGEEEMTFTFDASGLEGDDLVVFEELYIDTDLVAQHKDPGDESQTVQIPDGYTQAGDPDTGSRTMKAGGNVKITDTICYENLLPGKKYAVRGKVMLKPLGGEEEARELEAVMVDPDGKEIEEWLFTPGEKNGSENLSFVIPTDGLEGRSIVFFETLEYVNEEDQVIETLIIHEDINDERQTIHFPDGETTALGSDTGSHTANADEEVRILDEVRYRNLIPGEKYTVTGTLMDKETGAPVISGGTAVTAQKEFVPESADGSIVIEFTFDGKELAGRSVVAFEHMSSDGKDVFIHAELEDEEQRVDFPQIRTLAVDRSDGDHEIPWNGTAEIEDTVTYKNLTPGAKYRVCGVLMDKSSGKPVRSDGKEITGEAVFTAKEKSGTVKVSFRFDPSGLADGEFVVFETLYEIDAESGKENVTATHKDLGDQSQTVRKRTPSRSGKTSDDINAALPAALFVLAAAAITAVLFFRKRKA